ncbi:hypothetical protein AnigIFM50267_006166 [Aspergillus niger]|nr:hypothetical protein AnigIFM49718_003306 [Aspergillus niger]GKZ70512.1 hypothetical protein AnigIFM50267_006166 [Aspergillus niger]GLA12311.1 hypothetical protein AnigIFM62618_007448 [Aspergillus niger]
MPNRVIPDLTINLPQQFLTAAPGYAKTSVCRSFATSAAKASPETLNTPQSVALLAQETWKKPLSLVLRSVDDEIDVSLPLAQLSLDSMVAVEMHAWWKQLFGLDTSVLEMLSIGTLKKLGKQAADGLLGL